MRGVIFDGERPRLVDDMEVRDPGPGEMLVAVVGYSELTLQTKQAAGSTKAYFTFFVAAALIYLIISLVSLRLFGALEARVRRGQPKLG